MNKILLINRPDPKEISNEKKEIFFVLGDMDRPGMEERLINLLNKNKKLSEDDIVYRYNGVELKICTEDIPKFIKLFVDNDISIYSVYEIYNPRI